ncbi:hypothetical protein ACFFJY_10605 [Fictibacillus aquaticus]|uniref:Uncharacterized protein n=1 Tax=Fictibacillus aquaticus TaxID=2021314 RepID=A0A235FD40_9BACL|nr:hypothetical protein [Fictibacillus aquaticus]OYD58705.1 hypothetical protein CGZ90_02050 [Fictibacillus aquaticus]
MKIWQKAIVGTMLLGGFAGYTQYQKTAEPAWKVNENEFYIVKKLKEGLQIEYVQNPQLRVSDHFGLIQKNFNEVQLPGDFRTFKIEQFSFSPHESYLLYSVDLKESDKNELDVPVLNAKKAVYTFEDGSEEEFPLIFTVNGEAPANEFVYKHRLYRSVRIQPDFQQLSEDTWQKINTTQKLKLDQLTLTSKNSETKLKPVFFKVNPHNEESILGAEPLNRKIPLPDGGSATFKDFEISYYFTRITMEQGFDDHVVGFGGEYEGIPRIEQPVYELMYTEKSGFFIPLFNFDAGTMLNSGKKSSTITFDSVMYRSGESFNWKVKGKEMAEFNKNRVLKEKEILLGKKAGVSFYDLGYYYDGNAPMIKFTMKQESDFLVQDFGPVPKYRLEESFSDRSEYETLNDNQKKQMFRNVLTVKNADGMELKNFDIYYLENYTYGIAFHEGQKLPEEDLRIELSNIVYAKQLAEVETLKLSMPKPK